MQTEFIEITARSALNRVQNMPFKWSLSPYRGCQHACVYCYARGSHRHFALDSLTDFERRIIVKTNLPELLRNELRRPGWQRESVSMGTISDPYQPAEAHYRLTRRCLRILLDQLTPVTIVTKAPMVCQDRALLAELATGPGATVFFSITTLDPVLARRLEPGVAPARRRLGAMAELAAAGIRTGVMLAPILPGVTDKPAMLEAVVKEAVEHGATFLYTEVLHLRPGAREAYLPLLQRHYPHLLPAYERGYATADAPADYCRRTEGLVDELRDRYGISQHTTHTTEHQPAQLALAI